MHAELLQRLKEELKGHRQRLMEEIINLEQTGLGDTMMSSTSELSLYDNHPADLGSETFERGKDIALRDNAQLLLEEVDTALQKIDAHTYGKCEHCGDTIGEGRLKALPWAALCIRCQRGNESEQPAARRPLEELELITSSGQMLLDGVNVDSVNYDGEDILKDALQYGSSDSVQDMPGARNDLQAYPGSREQAGIVEPMDKETTD